MHVEFLVEEPSAETALRTLVPKILGDEVTFDIHPHQGKADLLGVLPFLLRGYAHWIDEEIGIVVLVDRDDDDCAVLKAELEQYALQAGLTSKSNAVGARFQVLNRIAVEELEAWFFGDIEAMRAAYPRIPVTLGRRRSFRDPDTIAGGTWETLERVLQRAGYHKGGLRKLEAALAIAQHMRPERNVSGSFRCFHDGLRALVGRV